MRFSLLRRPISSLVVVALVVVACTGETMETTTTSTTTTTTTTSPSTTTTVPPTTTTTLPPFTVEGAPPELVAVVESFYDYAAGRTTVVPPAPEAVVTAMTPADVETPISGVASVATFHGQGVATVEMDGDLFLAVGDGSEWRIVGGNWPNLAVPPYYGTAPRLVAVVGSDARPGEDPARTRADSIHFVALDGSGGGAVVGVPRDAYVQVPGIGRRKINAALALGGPQVMLQTFRDLTGLPVEGYVLTGFDGFQEMLGNVLGGIDLDVPFAIRDRAAGAVFEAGLQYLNGPAALALARPRKTLSGGDFARSKLQGLILIGAAQNVRIKGYGAIPRLMELSEPWMLTDLSPEQLLTFSALTIGSDLDSMPNVVAPGRAGSAGGASVVYLSDSVSALWADLADGRLDN
jgi:polyisoprenyl-teichoic acid--peptidoglycan teichoic acid transferase